MQGPTFIGNTLQSPRWQGDIMDRNHLEPWPLVIDPTQLSLFPDAASLVVQLTASASATATSITVTALTPSQTPATTLIAAGNIAIPAGSQIYFGTNKFAFTTADALIGATTITVAALPTALAGTEIGYYTPYPAVQTIASGTVVGRTYAQRAAGTGFRPALPTHDEIFLIAFDMVDVRRQNLGVAYRHASEVKENYLPTYATVLNVGVNNVQTVAITGTLSGGTFVVSNGTVDSAPIAYNANLAAIQTGYDSLYGATNTVIAGTVASHTVTFAAALAGIAQPTILVDGSALTGFTGATVTQTTPGGTPMLTLLRAKYRCILGKD